MSTPEVQEVRERIAVEVARIEAAEERLRARPLEWELRDWEIQDATERIRSLRARLRLLEGR